MIAQLQKKPVTIELEYKGKTYAGEGIPLEETCQDGVCYTLDITLNGEHTGIIHRAKSGWKMNEVKDQAFIDAIGDVILAWYE
jgi:hypothetical protein